MPNAERQTQSWIVTVIPKCQGSVTDVKTPCECKGCRDSARLSSKMVDAHEKKLSGISPREGKPADPADGRQGDSEYSASPSQVFLKMLGVQPTESLEA